MTTRVTGLDIGRASAKAVVLEVTGRSWRVVEVFEEGIERAWLHQSRAEAPTPPMGAPAVGADPDATTEADTVSEDDAVVLAQGLDAPTREAIARLAAQGAFDVESVVSALDPDDAYSAIVTLPFHTAREIEAVLPPQLEGKLPVEMDDLLLDFMVSGQVANEDYRIFTAAVEPARLALLLADLETHGVDPRYLDVPPYPLFTAGRTLLPQSAEAVAVLDIGATTTQLLIYAGDEIQYARSFAGGGDQMTEALAEVFALDHARAEDGKVREGFIDPAIGDARGATGNDAADIAAACRDATKRIVRQVRRSLHAHATETGQPASQLVVCGGVAGLPGLVEYLGQSIGVPARTMPTDHVGFSLPGFAEIAHRFTTALGLALRAAAAPTGSGFNFRKGPFVFKGSFDYLKERAPSLLFGSAAIVALVLVFAFAQVRVLKAESNALDAALGDVSEVVLGERLTDPGAIERRLRRAGRAHPFVPEVTATLLFTDIANAAGENSDLGYEANAHSIEVDLERGLFRVDGYADSAESVDSYQDLLREIDCLHEISRNELAQRSGTEGFEFGITGTADCSPQTEDD